MMPVDWLKPWNRSSTGVGAGASLAKVDPVPSSHHRLGHDLIGKAYSRLKVFPIGEPVGAHAGIVKYLAAEQCTIDRQSAERIGERDRAAVERIRRVWIEPIHAIVAFVLGSETS